MTESLKPNRRKTHIMTTSPAYYPRSATKCVTVLTPFLRHLNTGTLASFCSLRRLLLLASGAGKPKLRDQFPSKRAEMRLPSQTSASHPKCSRCRPAKRWPGSTTIRCRMLSQALTISFRNRLRCSQGGASLTPSLPGELTRTSVLSTPG